MDGANINEMPRRPLLASRQFRWLFAGEVTFVFAVQGQSVVRAWLTFKLTGSEFALGTMAAALAIPMMLIAPLAGVLVDRLERRSLIAFAQATIVLSELTLLTLLLFGQLQFWQLLCGTVALGLAFPICLPARQAMAVNLVGKDRLTAAMALSSSGISLARVLGPAVLGTLVEALGPAWAYACGVALFAVALLSLLGLPKDSGPLRDRPKRSVSSEMAEGVRLLCGHRLLHVLLLFGLIPVFLAMPVQQLMVVFADNIWKAGSSGLGLLQSMSGAGAVVGALWVSRMRNVSRLRVMAMSGLGSSLLLALFALSPSYWPAVGLAFAAYVLSAIFGTLNNSAMQLVIPDHARGRISSLMMMSVSLPMLGAVPVSALAEHIGAPIAVACACVIGSLAVLSFLAASPALRRLDETVPF